MCAAIDNSVYSYEDCVITRAGQKESKVCSQQVELEVLIPIKVILPATL